MFDHPQFSRIDNALKHWAELCPNKKAVTYLIDDCTVLDSLTYEQLDKRARTLACSLIKKHPEGSRAIILNKGDINFVVSFFGCLYANVIPVPVSKPMRRKEQWEKLENIVLDSGAEMIICSKSECEGATGDAINQSEVISKLDVVILEGDNESGEDGLLDNEGRNSDIAFLQYTSGSTGNPKGVVVSHENLVHNETQLKKVFEHTSDSVNVSWLPLFHDMGLIGCLLQSIFIGGHFVFMTPVTFLQRPIRWLQAITKFQANTSGAPNFAYELALSRITNEELESLDLSSWGLAFNGAETVRAVTLKRFSKKFAQAGFKPESFYPCYGLAEGTLFSTGGYKSDLPVYLDLDSDALSNGKVRTLSREEGGVSYVSLGHAHGDQDVRIIDASGDVCQDTSIGEICIKGGSIAKEYWGRTEESSQTFSNHYDIQGMENGPYMRTGDLGFLHDGNLYFVGRLKELIVVRGRNYYPQDIELTIQSKNASLRKGCGAAFGAEIDSEEKVVIVQEVERKEFGRDDLDEISHSVKESVTQVYGVSPYDVVLIKAGTLPKTSSGKIQRKKCREIYMSSRWNEIRLNPGDEKEETTEDNRTLVSKTIVDFIQDVKKVPAAKIKVDQPLVEYGLDSIEVIQLQQQIYSKFGVSIDVEDLLSDDSISDLSSLVESKLENSQGDATQSNTHEKQPLVPNQKTLWFLDSIKEVGGAYNVAFHIQLTDKTFQLDQVSDVLSKTVKASGLSRVRFCLSENMRVEQFLADQDDFKAETFETEWRSAEEMKSYTDTFVSRDFNLNAEAAIRALVSNSSEGVCVAFVAHHIVSDLHSLATLLKKFLKNLVGNNTQDKEAKEYEWEYLRYVQKHQNYLKSKMAEDDEEFWKKSLAGKLLPPILPEDAVSKESVENIGGSYDFSLSEETFVKLKDLSTSLGITINSLLLSGFSMLMHRLTNQDDVVIGVPTYGDRDGEFYSVPGYFVNTIIYRSTCDAEKKVSEFFINSNNRLNGYLKHAKLPIECIVEHLDLDRNQIRPEFFSVLFGYNNSPELSESSDLILGKLGKSVRIEGVELTPLGLPAIGVQTDLSLYMSDNQSGGIDGRILYKRSKFSEAIIHWWAESLISIYELMESNQELQFDSFPILSNSRSEKLESESRGSVLPLDQGWSIYSNLQDIAKSYPNHDALSFGKETLTYQDLMLRIDNVSRALRDKGVTEGQFVGVFMSKTIDCAVCLLSILRNGAAYIPLDPEFPNDRLDYIVKDSGAKFVIHDGMRNGLFLDETVEVIEFDSFISNDLTEVEDETSTSISLDTIAYLIYTSGSTGRPKGVPINYGNIQNLFLGLDEKVEFEQGQSHLYSVTSISFDIFVLELFWSITRGIKVTLPAVERRNKTKSNSVSIMFFSADETYPQEEQYDFILEASKSADELGLDSVWVPERHFHEFGASFPNPSTIAAAIASTTKDISIRAGSVVLPLHNPIRVAEEWSVVDGISKGRVGLAFASGWNPNDFVLSPESFSNRKDVLFEKLDIVKSLWKGEEMEFTNGLGEKTLISTKPRPVQSELPVWITAAGSVETFEMAGSQGLNVLTHLLGQNIDQLEEKITAYKKARIKAGYGEDDGCVTVMLHTYLCDSDDEAREVVELPFKKYLGTSIDIMKPIANALGLDPDKNKDLIIQHAFDRYYSQNALFGTVDSCKPLVNKLTEIGASEIACLIDFGVPKELVLKSFPLISALKETQFGSGLNVNKSLDVSALKGVTHMQSTPSFLQLIMSSNEGRSFVSSLNVLMVGGEPVAQGTVNEAKSLGCKSVLNMYGPTETTVWSAVTEIEHFKGGYANINGPLTNTQLYVVDDANNILPPGFVGELCISGEGVSNGYWNNKEKTEKAFVLDEIKNGEVVYKTGDLVRQSIDGGFVFISRKDNQCKLAGYRIELGEIEHALLENECVSKAAAIIAKVEGIDQLVAFVESSDEVNKEEIVEGLEKFLPRYMIPSSVVRIEKMPRTPNGKLDRNALSEIAQDVSSNENDVVRKEDNNMVEGDVEKQVITIWKDLLNLEAVRVADNFFEIGGNSMMMPVLKNKLDASFGISIDIVDVLKNPTVKLLSSHIKKNNVGGDDSQGLERPDIVERAARKKKAINVRRARKSEASHAG